MKKIDFTNSHFLSSVFAGQDYPKRALFEIAVAGRSNVGKSSLINHLLAQKKLAKISSRPGKTRSLNFYEVDNKLMLCDLPGYGFARISKSEQAAWAENIEKYFHSRSTLRLILLLLDSRRSEPLEADQMFLQWAAAKKIPLLLLFTKSDKQSFVENEKSAAGMKEACRALCETIYDSLSYSIFDAKARAGLIAEITRRMQEWD